MVRFFDLPKCCDSSQNVCENSCIVFVSFGGENLILHDWCTQRHWREQLLRPIFKACAFTHQVANPKCRMGLHWANFQQAKLCLCYWSGALQPGSGPNTATRSMSSITPDFPCQKHCMMTSRPPRHVNDRAVCILLPGVFRLHILSWLLKIPSNFLFHYVF